MRLHILVALTLVGFSAALASAQDSPAIVAKTIRIDGRGKVTVTTPHIALGDIAEISSPRFTDDEAVIALRRIAVANSPLPGQTTNITGNEIVNRMRAAGVDLNRVGYSFPSDVAVVRASRTLGLEEVRRAVQEMFAKSGRDIELRDVRLNQSVEVVPGDISIEARPVGNAGAGLNNQMNLDLTIKSPSMPEIRIPTVAMVTEWREVPIATRPLIKGAVIGDEDLERARVNISALPRDIALDEKQVVGLEIKQDIAVGEVFRRDKMVQPIVVPAGSKVMMVFKSKFLEASASGIAVEAGIVGQEIKVKNETSKRILSTIVKERGLVEVVR